MDTGMVVQYPSPVAHPQSAFSKVGFYGDKDFMSCSEKEEKNMWFTLRVSVSILLIIRCGTLGVSRCLSEFLFPHL